METRGVAGVHTEKPGSSRKNLPEVASSWQAGAIGGHGPVETRPPIPDRPDGRPPAKGPWPGFGIRRVYASVGSNFPLRGFTSPIATVALAQPLQLRTATGDGPRGEETPFGAQIIDIALTFDRAARQSLVAHPDIDVPAKMTFRDASGANKKCDVRIHGKGQVLGSKRPLGGKPAFKVKLGKDDRFFGLEYLTLNNMVQDATMMREALGYHRQPALLPATGGVGHAAGGGKCVAVAPGHPQGAALIQVTCAQDAAQTWHVQRSILPIGDDRGSWGCLKYRYSRSSWSATRDRPTGPQGINEPPP